MPRFPLAGLAACCALLCTSAPAQPGTDYPVRPVRMLTPTSAGGGGDAFARLLADQLGKRLGQSFVVENNAGAAGTIAIAQLSHAKPDGYTIALGTMTTTTLAPAVYKALPYDPVKDLTIVARVGTSPIVLVTTKDYPANDLKTFIAQAKASGKPLQFGTWGLGSTGHFCAEVLAQKTGIRLDHIPFKGSSPVVTALLGGVVKVAWLDIGSSTAAVKSGKIKALAMCTRRSPSFPGVPTYKEQGVDFDQWTGWTLLGPAGLPRAVADKLEHALRDTLQDPVVRDKMLVWGITPDFLPGPEQTAVNTRDIDVWKKVAREAAISLD